MHHAIRLLSITLILAIGSARAQQPQDPKLPLASGIFIPADEPLRIDAIGLTMQIPAGSTMQAESFADRAVVELLDPQQRWRLRVQTHRTSNPEHTIESVNDAAIEQLRRSVSVQGGISQATLLERNATLRIHDTPADRFYLQLPQPGSQEPHIRGYTIARAGPSQFVSFELFTSSSEFAGARPIYEAMIATVRLEDPERLALSRGSAIRAGQAVFSRLSRDDYVAALAAVGEQWQRLYRPSPDSSSANDIEMGYRRIRARLGTRGELDSRNPRPVGQTGYLITIDSRLLSGQQVIDSSAGFFLSTDREQEAWLINMTISRNGQNLNWTETGARQGQSMDISIAQTGSPPRSIKPLIQGEGYIAQVETYLLPALLARQGVPLEFGFYAYQSAHESIRLRRDSLRQSGNALGSWSLTTTPGEGQEPYTTFMDDRGQTLRVELPTGARWEPTDPDALLSRWREQGLPVD